MQDKLQRLIERCKAGVHITINEHRDYYMTAAAKLAELDAQRGPENKPEIGDEVRQGMIDTDTIINLHFYPDTPISFYEVYHHDLNAALDEALAALKMETS